jgi:hypothetical protein
LAAPLARLKLVNAFLEFCELALREGGGGLLGGGLGLTFWGVLEFLGNGMGTRSRAAMVSLREVISDS